MIKHLAASALLALSLSGAALAQTSAPAETPATPTSAEDCIKHASDLAQHAEAKNLADDKLDKIEELLSKMETHCDAKQFVEAMTVAKDIRTMIDGQ